MRHWDSHNFSCGPLKKLITHYFSKLFFLFRGEQEIQILRHNIYPFFVYLGLLEILK